MDELKSCPFCGGKATYDYSSSRKKCILLVKVVCETCGCGTKVFPCEDQYHNSCQSWAETMAEKAWNRRTV